MKLNELFTEADPSTLGSMNDKMKDVLSKVDGDDKAKEKAAVDAADKEKLANKIKYSDSPEMEEYIKMLKSHDWTYDYSDDHSVWKRGSAEAAEIRRLGDKVDPDRELYKKYSPFHDDVKDESQYTPTRDKEDLEAKKKALQDLQVDPNTSKDPELKKEIMKRKAALDKDANEMMDIDEESLDDMSKNREFAHTFKQYIRGNASKDQVAELLRGRGNMEDFADEIHRKGVEYGGAKGARIKELADHIRKDSNIFDLPGKALDRIKRLAGMGESATAGATSSGNIASVEAPHLSPGKARGKKSYTGSPWGGKSGTKAPPQPQVKQPKAANGTAKNALDMKNSIFGENPVRR